MSLSAARRSAFVGTFVNEMYAVLLGIGMGSIVFRKDFTLTDVTGLASAAFVLVVVLVYWWDWVEAAQRRVISTFRELTIDLLFGFVFLLLFAYSNDSLKLSAALIALACLDFVWVLNFCLTHETRRQISSKQALRWLVAKLLALAIFVGAFLLITWLQGRVAREWTLLVVLVSFFVVRCAFFRVLSRITQYCFRPATPEDAEAIATIHNAHALPSSEDAAPSSGFLLAEKTPESINRAITVASSRYFVATTPEGEVVGFVAVQDALPKPQIGSICWNHETARERCLAQSTRHIDTVAVAPGFNGRGVADFLYEQLEATDHAAAWTAFVAIAPASNVRSLRFHLSHGFVSAGAFSAPEFKGLTNYRSELLVCEPRFRRQVRPQN